MTYVNNNVLLAMSHQCVWDEDLLESFHPRRSFVVVKIFSAAPVYALTTVCVPATQERLHFLRALTGLHQFQKDVAALVYMPQSCIYMLEPSSGNHYTLLHLTRDKDICIGAFSSFMAPKLTVVSKHCGGNMGVHLKLPPNFGLQLDSDDLMTEPPLHHCPIWKNADFVVCGNNRRPLLVDGESVAMESPLKVASVDQFTALQCAALTNVGCEPKFTNDAFAFRETVAEMRQRLNREKAEATERRPSEPMITDDHHQEALATARAPIFASKSSDIQVVFPPGAKSVNPVKYRTYLGVKGEQGEEATTASTGTMAQTP